MINYTKSLGMFQYHPFHLVTPSPWPIYTSFSLLGLTTTGVLTINGFNYSSILLLFSLLLLIFSMSLWFRDITTEATYMGDHTLVVQIGLNLGIGLFIVSEALFFLAIFWTYFHTSLSPIIEVGTHWPPYGIDAINPFELPLLNTIILLASGVALTHGHHSLIEGDRSGILIGTVITVVLAVIFTLLQGIEYSVSSFSISDATYGSIFFFGTGFHGFHVMIGTAFIAVGLWRMYAYHVSDNHHIGVESSILYWHFVDIIWLILFISFYYWGSDMSNDYIIFFSFFKGWKKYLKNFNLIQRLKNKLFRFFIIVVANIILLMIGLPAGDSYTAGRYIINFILASWIWFGDEKVKNFIFTFYKTFFCIIGITIILTIVQYYVYSLLDSLGLLAIISGLFFFLEPAYCQPNQPWPNTEQAEASSSKRARSASPLDEARKLLKQDKSSPSEEARKLLNAETSRSASSSASSSASLAEDSNILSESNRPSTPPLVIRGEHYSLRKGEPYVWVATGQTQDGECSLNLDHNSKTIYMKWPKRGINDYIDVVEDKWLIDKLEQKYKDQLEREAAARVRDAAIAEARRKSPPIIHNKELYDQLKKQGRI